MPGDGVHGVEAGFHGPSPHAAAGFCFPVLFQGNRSGGGHFIAGEYLEGEQLHPGIPMQALLSQQGHDVLISNFPLAVRQLLKAQERCLKRLAAELISQLPGAIRQGMASAELAQAQAALGNSQILGCITS